MKKKFGIKSFEDYWLDSLQLGLKSIGLYSMILYVLGIGCGKSTDSNTIGICMLLILILSFPARLIFCYLTKKRKDKETVIIRDAQILSLEIEQPLIFSIYNHSRGISNYRLNQDWSDKLKIYSSKFQSQTEVTDIETVTTYQNEIKKYIVKTSDGTTYEIYPIKDFDITPEQPL